MIPALSPRRLSAEAAAMIARQTGRNGPSAAPITTRVANRVPKFHDRPESTEQNEIITCAASRNGFLRPIESDQRPTKYAPRAQVTDSAEPSAPISVLLSERSF